MVFRIHFTVEDLARTHVAQPPPLMELNAAVRALQTRRHAVCFGAWRRAAFARLGPEARLVLDLIPPSGPTPTFLTPAGPGSPQELLERTRATPRSRIRADLAFIAECRPLPSWVHRLPDDPDLRRRLFDALDHVHSVLLSPTWPCVVDEAAADRAVRTRQLLTGGVEALFGSLDPRRIRWNPPVLEVALLSGMEGDLHLGGRGLLLVPSLFGTDSPGLDDDAEPQPVLRYPARRDRTSGTPLLIDPAAPPAAPPHARSSLASLMGPTRAAVLTAIAEHPGCSTKELAAFTGLASPSASEHATTLRAAGLVRTVRHRNTALHSPTELGTTLLDTPGR
ncbi:winged helix-turn-helix domain-containing protein [Streptomyces cacaoi]